MNGGVGNSRRPSTFDDANIIMLIEVKILFGLQYKKVADHGGMHNHKNPVELT